MSKNTEHRQAGMAGAIGSLEHPDSDNKHLSFHVDSSVDNKTGYGQFSLRLYHCDGAKLQGIGNAILAVVLANSEELGLTAGDQ